MSESVFHTNQMKFGICLLVKNEEASLRVNQPEVIKTIGEIDGLSVFAVDGYIRDIRKFIFGIEKGANLCF